MVLLRLSALSQNLPTTTDSITAIPNYQLRTALRLIEAGKYAKAQLEIERRSNGILAERLALKDTVIQQYKEKDDIRKGVNFLNDRIITDKDKQNEFLSAWVKDLNKQVSRANGRTWLVGGIGIAGIVATILILK